MRSTRSACTVIAKGTQAYDEIMNKMWNLWDATENDDGYTAGCDSDQLDEFIEATRAKH